MLARVGPSASEGSVAAAKDRHGGEEEQNRKRSNFPFWRWRARAPPAGNSKNGEFAEKTDGTSRRR